MPIVAHQVSNTSLSSGVLSLRTAWILLPVWSSTWAFYAVNYYEASSRDFIGITHAFREWLSTTCKKYTCPSSDGGSGPHTLIETRLSRSGLRSFSSLLFRLRRLVSAQISHGRSSVGAGTALSRLVTS